jgi:hypothetical protein
LSSSWRGASSLPLMVAGQCEEQRPHSVQEYMSSTCFQVNWLMYEVPKLSRVLEVLLGERAGGLESS